MNKDRKNVSDDMISSIINLPINSHDSHAVSLYIHHSQSTLLTSLAKKICANKNEKKIILQHFPERSVVCSNLKLDIVGEGSCTVRTHIYHVSLLEL